MPLPPPRERTPAERLMGFPRHAIVYVLVNAGLTTLNFTRNPDHLWFYWPLAGWGLGLLLHFVMMVIRIRSSKSIKRNHHSHELL